MSSALEQHTVVPRQDAAPELRRLASVLGFDGDIEQQAKLIGPDGTEVTLPSEVYDVLRDVAAAMAQGMAISIAPQHAVLTTQQAADLLNISRPTLIKLLEEEEIPFQRHGRHRRVRLADVLDYQERSRKDRRSMLAEHSHTASEDGTADRITGFVQTR